MSEDKEAGVVPAEPTKKKVFSRTDVQPFVQVSVHLPRLFPDYDPWVFKLRLKLSGEAEEQRQKYLALAPAKQTETVQQQALNEVCDLLIELPTGFADLKSDGRTPGLSYRSYVESTSNPQVRDMLYSITEGASNLYWASITPREFRNEV